MPFVTEEIYSMLPIKESESIMITNYPKYEKDKVFKESELVEDQIDFIKKFRNIKAENSISKDAKVLIETNTNIDIVKKILKLEDNIIDKPLNINSYNVSSNNIKATIYFEKTETEEEKQLKENTINQLKQSIERREKLLSNPNYVSKAPANIVEMDRIKLEEEKNKLKELLK